MCSAACMSVHHMQVVNRGQKRETDPFEMELAPTMRLKPNPGFFDFLELVLQAVRICHVSTYWSFARAVNHQDIFLAHTHRHRYSQRDTDTHTPLPSICTYLKLLINRQIRAMEQK